MSVRPAVPPAASVEPAPVLPPAPPLWQVFLNRLVTLCLVELRKLRHDRTELYTRAIQPTLWLLIFGETFTKLRAIPTGSRPYLDYLAPGIMAQSALFIAIFFGIQIIWERDAGVLTKLLATPTPRAALVTGKAFAAGIRAASQVVIVLLLSAILRIGLNWNPLHLLAALLLVVVGSAFFSMLSVTLAGLVLSRDRLMGIGQALTMPLFFASNALYPTHLMPGWLQALSKINPLSYEVDGLRGVLLGTPNTLGLDIGVLVVALIAALSAAAALLPRLAR
ncbi:MAG TPA: ABC transporter permease [Chloroflexota bacterium]|nr:ABC transporter permease [Chloroflexota bacterium]